MEADVGTMVKKLATKEYGQQDPMLEARHLGQLAYRNINKLGSWKLDDDYEPKLVLSYGMKMCDVDLRKRELVLWHPRASVKNPMRSFDDAPDSRSQSKSRSETEPTPLAEGGHSSGHCDTREFQLLGWAHF